MTYKGHASDETAMPAMYKDGTGDCAFSADMIEFVYETSEDATNDVEVDISMAMPLVLVGEKIVLAGPSFGRMDVNMLRGVRGKLGGRGYDGAGTSTFTQGVQIIGDYLTYVPVIGKWGEAAFAGGMCNEFGNIAGRMRSSNYREFLDIVHKIVGWAYRRLPAYLCFVYGEYEDPATSGLDPRTEVDMQMSVPLVDALVRTVMPGAWSLVRAGTYEGDLALRVCAVTGEGSKGLVLKMRFDKGPVILAPAGFNPGTLNDFSRLKADYKMRCTRWLVSSGILHTLRSVEVSIGIKDDGVREKIMGSEYVKGLMVETMIADAELKSRPKVVGPGVRGMRGDRYAMAWIALKKGLEGL